MAAAADPAAPVVVLARPQLAENVGTAARAMLNFGLAELRLAAPEFGWPNAKALNAASGAYAVLNTMTIHASLGDALGDVHCVLATTARGRGLNKPVLTPRAAAALMRQRLAEGARVGVVFGPERTGLETEELLLAEALVRVPLNPAFSSLNLAQAVLLVGYEWHLSADRTPERREPGAGRPATHAELDGLMDHLVRELDEADFFRADDRRISLSRTLRNLFARGRLREPELHLLHGVIKALARGRQTGASRAVAPDRRKATMATVRYIVDDVDATSALYTEQLGFAVVARPAPGFVILARADLRLLLSANAGPGGAAQPMPDGRRPEPGGWNRIQIEVEDLEATVQRLRAAGASFRNDIVSGLGGKQILLEDAAGNPVELFEPPREPRRP